MTKHVKWEEEKEKKMDEIDWTVFANRLAVYKAPYQQITLGYRMLKDSSWGKELEGFEDLRKAGKKLGIRYILTGLFGLLLTPLHLVLEVFHRIGAVSSMLLTGGLIGTASWYFLTVHESVSQGFGFFIGGVVIAFLVAAFIGSQMKDAE